MADLFSGKKNYFPERKSLPCIDVLNILKWFWNWWLIFLLEVDDDSGVLYSPMLRPYPSCPNLDILAHEKLRDFWHSVTSQQKMWAVISLYLKFDIQNQTWVSRFIPNKDWKLRWKLRDMACVFTLRHKPPKFWLAQMSILGNKGHNCDVGEHDTS